MKKILSSLMIVAILLTLTAPAVYAAENAQFLYDDEDIKELYYEFEYLAADVEAAFGADAGLAYRNYCADMESNDKANWLIDTALNILGETPDKKYYTQILVNMIALQEYDLASQLQNQGQFDRLKNIKDYALDTVDIAATVIGMDEEFKALTETIKVLNESVGLLQGAVNEIKYYELTIRNYANAEHFLCAVNEYSDNELLSEAAYELRTANELLVKERFHFIANMGAMGGGFLAENYCSDLSFDLLKNLDDYKTDSSVRDFVDFGESAFKALDKLKSTGEAVFKSVMLGGDILFGTTNTFRRHCEMKTMYDIADAITEAYEDIDVNPDKNATALFGDIRSKCEYYKMLISTHLRGEHLIYSLVYNDGGVLSALTRWMDEYRGEQSISKWYNAQVERCELYYRMVDDLFIRLTDQKFVVQNGFELHDGFIEEIEQLNQVPEGYIGVYSFNDFKKIADSCPSDAHITSIYNVETEFNTAKYILMNDIDFPADYDSAGAFYGVLDGNGYTMRNLSEPLFLRIGNATIRNLGMEIRHTIDTEDQEYYFGTIAKYCNGFNNKNGCVINNCFVKGSVNITCRNGFFGSLIGRGDGATISNCYNNASITVKTRQTAALGGICGRTAPVTNCYNTGSLSLHTTGENTLGTETMEVAIGGILGYNYSENTANCYNAGSVAVSTSLGCKVYSGGITGYLYPSTFNTYIENCYNIGTVTNDWAADYDTSAEYGTTFVPSHCTGGITGFVGHNTFITQCWNGGTVAGEHFTGGIVGYSSSDEGGAIMDCYNVGAISGVQFVGGILGKDLRSTGIVNCYNAGVIGQSASWGSLAGTLNNGEENFQNCFFLIGTGTATGASVKYSGATALNDAQFADPATFTGFDFRKVWKLREDDARPQLKTVSDN